jgi:ABC-type branched-subunit amino acid transport system ATPase component
LTVSGLRVAFGGVTALDDLTMSISPGMRVGVVGPNGAGKTTLLSAITGFVPATDGRIALGETEITRMSIRERAQLGVVRGFQTVRLVEDVTVLENVLVGRERLKHATVLGQLVGSPKDRMSRRADREHVRGILSSLGLERYASTIVAELAFPLRRMVEVARVAAAEPNVMLLDEPAAGLDETSRLELTDALLSLHAEAGFTLLVIEHDVRVVQRACDTCVALEFGSLIASGPTDTVMVHPEVRRALFGEVSA